ncbi:hypothetical protein BDZ94DRAFT_1069243 [Collybia nuda]|uniref:Uncharacterized protein n=1 Tax=Collybia nuda TaxID=64659 RepID=A0A9P5XYA9_9AGAR|nr:hypothetical protein BDZ94DRAFT_1069243 [Collybia nuda]
MVFDISKLPISHFFHSLSVSLPFCYAYHPLPFIGLRAPAYSPCYFSRSQVIGYRAPRSFTVAFFSFSFFFSLTFLYHLIMFFGTHTYGLGRRLRPRPYYKQTLHPALPLSFRAAHSQTPTSQNRLTYISIAYTYNIRTYNLVFVLLHIISSFFSLWFSWGSPTLGTWFS